MRSLRADQGTYPAALDLRLRPSRRREAAVDPVSDAPAALGPQIGSSVNVPSVSAAARSIVTRTRSVPFVYLTTSDVRQAASAGRAEHLAAPTSGRQSESGGTFPGALAAPGAHRRSPASGRGPRRVVLAGPRVRRSPRRRLGRTPHPSRLYGRRPFPNIGEKSRSGVPVATSFDQYHRLGSDRGSSPRKWACERIEGLAPRPTESVTVQPRVHRRSSSRRRHGRREAPGARGSRDRRRAR
jgi:hypothetical protein